MKRALILLMVLLMAFPGMAAHAEVAPEAALEGGAPEELADAQDAPEVVFPYDELTVGTVTPFSGSFFSQMWGNVTSDLDVRLLVHGYNLVQWRGDEGAFAVDPSVVSGIIVTENAEGDRTYTLTLYDNLTYSDGTPITARDYAFSLLLSMAPQIAEIGGSVRPAQYLLGYEDYLSGAAPSLAGVRLPGEDMLAITVSRDYLPFFYEMALLDCVPTPIHVVAPGCAVVDDGAGVAIVNEDPEETEPRFTADLLRQTLLDEQTGYLSHPTVGSGPYRLTDYDGQTVRLEINPYYKGNSDGQKPQIQRLIYTVVSSDAMVDQLSRGEVGLLNKCLSVDALREGTALVAGGETFSMSNYTRNGMSFISFCCERAPMDSAEVRRAIAMCLNKQGMVDDAVGAYGLQVDGYYGLGQWMVSLVDGSQTYPVPTPDDDAPQADWDAYDAEVAAWDALTLDNVPVYAFDVDAAAALLEQAGWNLNAQGEPFRPGEDDVRCKLGDDGELQALSLKLIAPEGSSLNLGLEANFVEPLAQAGVALTVETLPMPQLLERYYRRQERDCDMFALATNFDVVFDPSVAFMPDGDAVNPYNATGLNDDALYQLAVDMRQTASDDALSYCAKWVAFQERFQTLEPMIPIYSNVYFDFYPRVLRNYEISSSISWAQAIVGAYLSDAPDEEETAEDDAVEIIDSNWP